MDRFAYKVVARKLTRSLRIDQATPRLPQTPRIPRVAILYLSCKIEKVKVDMRRFEYAEMGHYVPFVVGPVWLILLVLWLFV